MHELWVTVDRVEGACSGPVAMVPGVRFAMQNGRLIFPGGGPVCLFALQSILPLLPAKERLTDGDPAVDWMGRVHEVQCPDPDGRVIWRIQQVATGSVEEEIPELDAKALDRLRELQEPGEPDMLLELVELFLKDAPLRLQAIWDSLDQNRAESVAQTTHSLKGSANNIGARRLAEVCAQMESAAKTGDLATAAQCRKDLQHQYERVCFLLEQEAKKQKSVAP